MDHIEPAVTSLLFMRGYSRATLADSSEDHAASRLSHGQLLGGASGHIGQCRTLQGAQSYLGAEPDAADLRVASLGRHLGLSSFLKRLRLAPLDFPR